MDQTPDGTVERRVTRVHRDGPPEQRDDIVACEVQLRIVVNDQELVVASVLPGQEREFAYGLLLASGVIAAAADVRGWQFDAERGVAFVELAGDSPLADFAAPPVVLGTACGSEPLTVSSHRLSPIESELCIRPQAILHAADALREDSVLFRETGGVHSVALCDRDGATLLRAEDIGRHNACDKLIGAALLGGEIDAAQCFMMCTGRLSSEMATKAWRFGVPLLASRSAPTSRAVEIADSARLTLVGFVRARRFNVYSYPRRVEGGEPC